MSTTPVESWAVDLTTLGPVYPFVGTEFVMFIVAVALWIGFHIVQIRQENRTLNEEAARMRNKENMAEALKLTNGH